MYPICSMIYFNPRPPRGERRPVQWRNNQSGGISIHALREESDPYSTHALVFVHKFQSTPSARRATSGQRHCADHLQNFNPRPPRGERRSASYPTSTITDISIHALREESDLFLNAPTTIDLLFQSTPSARRATHIIAHFYRFVKNFNPRPPRGERPCKYPYLHHWF